MQQLLAKSISYIFSPLTLWPLLLLLFWKNALPSELLYQPSVWLVLTLELAIPILLLAVFIKLKLVSDVDITKIRERRLFFTCVLLIHALSTYLVWNYFGPDAGILRLWILSVEIAGTLITFGWKISGHLAITSTTITAVVVMFFARLDEPVLWLLYLLLPIVAWSRVVLHKHTLAQTIAGAALPIVMLFVGNVLVQYVGRYLFTGSSVY
jgi:membrane-associated phospholipid phosphatase